MKEEALTNTNIEHFHKRNVSLLVAKLGNVPLTGQTILNECKKIKGLKFLGVFMVDQLPPLRAGTFVLNIDVSTGKGIHWTAGVIEGKTIYIYDSFGRRAKNLIQVFRNKVKSKGFRIKNTDLTDSDQYGTTSVDCGHRTISSLKIYKTYGLKGYKLL